MTISSMPGTIRRIAVVLMLILLISLAGKTVRAENNGDGFLLLRDFSQGPQGWRYSGSAGSGAPETGVIEGTACIVFDVRFPEPIQIYKERSLRGILGSVRRIRMPIYVPPGAVDVGVSFFAKNKDGTWFHAAAPGRLRPGVWNRVMFDLDGPDSSVIPDGHFGAWGNTAAAATAAIGVQFYSSHPFTGRFGVSRIEGAPAEKPEIIPALYDLQMSSDRVAVYSGIEITFRLPFETTNPFDPEAIDVTAEFITPAGAVVTVPAFYYRDFMRSGEPSSGPERLIPAGRDCWKVRYTPLAEGTHTFVIRAHSPTAALAGGRHSFEALAPVTPGFVTVDPDDHRYFRTGDGAFFYPVGHNVRSPNDPRCANVLGIDVPPDRGTFAYDDFIAKMSANGENLIEIWMCSWWTGLEWIPAWPGYEGLGYYNLANAWKLDYLIDAAARHGMYVHLVIDNHGKLSIGADPEWDLSPYNVKNGGFLNHPNEFFTDEKARELYRRKLRYILARWGWSATVMGFELWSELDLVGKNVHRTEPVYAWHDEMARIIHACPVPRLVTTHYSGDYRVVDAVMAGRAGIDYVVGDGYRDNGAFPDLARRTAERYRTFRKPGFITEYGGSWAGTTEARLTADLHAGLWSAFVTDIAGTPLLWWFDFIDRRDLYSHYRAFSRFIAGEDKRGRELQTAAIKLNGPRSERLDSMAALDAQGGYIWIYDRSLMYEYPAEPESVEAFEGLAAVIPTTGEGSRTIEVWDTREGIMLGTETLVIINRQLEIRLPVFRIDCALKIKPGE